MTATHQRRRTFWTGLAVVGIVSVLLGMTMLLARANDTMRDLPAGVVVWLVVMGVLYTGWVRTRVRHVNVEVAADQDNS